MSQLFSEFTVEQAIEIQKKHLDDWKKVLIPEVYLELHKYATRNNNTAVSGYNIIRGSDLSNFVQNYKMKDFIIITKEQHESLIESAFKKGECWGVTYSTWFVPTEEDTRKKIEEAKNDSYKTLNIIKK
jgi:hypothetical protein